MLFTRKFLIIDQLDVISSFEGKIFQNDVKVDFGVIDPSGHINGLLGLDLLMEVGATIDLKNLEIIE